MTPRARKKYRMPDIRQRMIRVKPVGVVGPLPGEDSVVLVALASADKMVIVPCPYGDGLAASKMMSAPMASRGSCGSYDFVPNLMLAVGATLEMAVLSRQDDEFMASVYVTPSGKKTVKISSDNPAVAINFALAADCPLYVEATAWREAADAAAAMVRLSSHMSLWPLPALTKTDSLRTFSEFMDEVMPGGRMFGGPRPS